MLCLTGVALLSSLRIYILCISVLEFISKWRIYHSVRIFVTGVCLLILAQKSHKLLSVGLKITKNLFCIYLSVSHILYSMLHVYLEANYDTCLLRVFFVLILLAILAVSNVATITFKLSLSIPRFVRPERLAGVDVIFFKASGRLRSCLSRTIL